MGIIGILVVTLAMMGLVALGFDDTRTVLIMLTILGVGVYLLLYDVGSPVEITETLIRTDDYEKYDVDIDSDRLGIIKEIERDGIMWGSILEDTVRYQFIDFLEE